MYYLSQSFDILFFSYISVRAGAAFFIALILCLFIMPRYIRYARAKKANQPIYELVSHAHKQETPTMGGLVFVSAALIASLLCSLFNYLVILGLLCLFLFFLIGLIDDLGKIYKKDNHSGLSAKNKLLLQIIFALFIALALYFSGFNLDFYLPFYKYSLFNGGVFFIFFWVLVLISTSNAVNLTDGLDGLASVPSIFSIFSLCIFMYLSGNAIYSSYLFLPRVEGLGELVIPACALIGALIGFLWYNCYPAAVFMGDSGSLSLGAFIGFLAIASKNELLLLLIAFVFLMETLSVILQVGSFKVFNKRLFKMAPIHHHFEKLGWVENKIIIRFWIIALLSNLIALINIKLR